MNDPESNDSMKVEAVKRLTKATRLKASDLKSANRVEAAAARYLLRLLLGREPTDIEVNEVL